MSAPFTRERDWLPTANEAFAVGVARWVRVHGDVPNDLVLRTTEGDGVFVVEPGRLYDFGASLPSLLVAPPTANGSSALTVCSGSGAVGMSELAPRGGAPRPWLEHVSELIRTIAAGASLTMATRTYIPYSTDAGRAVSHPFSRFLVVAEGDRSFTIDATDVFDGTNTVLIEQRTAIARPGGRFSTHFVLDFPYPRLALLATNTSPSTLTLALHLYGTR